MRRAGRLAKGIHKTSGSGERRRRIRPDMTDLIPKAGECEESAAAFEAVSFPLEIIRHSFCRRSEGGIGVKARWTFACGGIKLRRAGSCIGAGGFLGASTWTSNPFSGK